jgi:dTDP-4-dehydrorhamnose reductase
VRLLVIGEGGQVGQAVVAGARVRGIDVIGTSRRAVDPDLRLDLLDPASIRRVIRAASPTHVVLAAAATSVVDCERDPVGTSRVNVDGALVVADTAREVAARLVFVSSDYLFDGEAGPYDETAQPRPINAYGRQKLVVEEGVSGMPDAAIVRTCQVFGPDPRRANYVLRVADDLLAGRRVRAATDLFGTPTFVADLVASVLDLATGQAQGVWHVAGSEFVSRYALARLTAVAANVDPHLVDGVPFAEIADEVPRPRRAGLVSRRLHDPPFVATPLREALSSLFASAGP